MLLPLHNNLTVAPLLSGISPSHRPHFAEYRRHAYMSNGWDPVYRWNGRSSVMELAGIVGPDQDLGTWVPVAVVPAYVAGDTTIGLHRVRYRYQDSRTGYVSNPSVSVEINVLEDGVQYPFTVETTVGGGTLVDIRLSPDAKVDRLVLEATVADGTEFFLVDTFPLLDAAGAAITSVIYSVGDAALEHAFLPWDPDGHDVPPIGRWILSHRERLWIFSQVVHSTGNASPTNGAVEVAEGSIDPDWRVSGLGDQDLVPKVFASVAWLIQFEGDTEAYEIDWYDSVTPQLLLREPYPGTTKVDSAYKIFSRANLLWVSNPGFPEGFAPLTFINGPQGELSGEITACMGFQTALLVFSEQAMYRLTWDIGPQIDPTLVPVSTKYGALSQRVVVNVETTVYTMDKLGWHSFGGVRDVHMSREIDELLDLIDFSKLDLFHAVYLPRTRAIRWHVCYFGDVYPRHYFQYDLDTKSWGTGSFEVGISESRLVLTLGGPRVLLGDENGWLWAGDTGTADGCQGADSHLEVAAGTVPTSILVTRQDLEVGTFGMAGAVAYWVEGREARHVYANTANQISTDPFSVAPAVGDTILVGRVRAKLKTAAFSAARGARMVARQDYSWLLMNPTTELRHALVRFYEDGSADPKVDWGSVRSKGSVDGVESPGSVEGLSPSDWRVSLNGGTRRVPTGETFKRTLEIEIEIEEGDARVEIYGLELDSPDEHESLD